jgi:tRNASer (uridine44-2'-O)-methyltransferase
LQQSIDVLVKLPPFAWKEHLLRLYPPEPSMMVVFDPRAFEEDAEPRIHDGDGNVWAPILEHPCSFDPSQFVAVMTNFVHNPNLNSKWLFRADILSTSSAAPSDSSAADYLPRLLAFRDFNFQEALVRRLIPRNPMRDQPLEQTCLFFRSDSEDLVRSLVVYLSHASSADEVPYYHPAVPGVAHLHEWDPRASTGTVSVHLWPFARDDLRGNVRLQRTALALLQLLHKHGQGMVDGYVKRVKHDSVIPRRRFQDRHTDLKARYAKGLLDTWAEQTDPTKHVFEDIAIAAFLIELWADMYKDVPFPGFVDIGCGNGLLVHLLRSEGYTGWGFDARARKSWAQYGTLQETTAQESASCSPTFDTLQTRVLLPSFVQRDQADDADVPFDSDGLIHDGVFPEGTFIISNHSDELTPWTPILAAQSRSPFMVIPCCSHDLSGAKFRAPPPKDTSKGSSAYAGLVAWVADIAAECNYEVETEMLRIPSTRNTALVGRKITGDADIEGIIAKYGGTAGYYDNVRKLLKGGPRGH